jgi:D-alanyl-D-alanine endopeptidase (penicillin-binding protein 7)
MVPRKTVQKIFLATAAFFAVLQAQASNFTDLQGSPGLKSASAVVIADDGSVIYTKDAHTVRPIASVTKLMTAMVVLDSGLDLDEAITVTKEDRDLVQLTGSRLEYGATLRRREMIMLAIMSSENRAAMSLGRTYPGGMPDFVAAMNRKATELGMTSSRFADPAGLSVENQSTAADLSRMVTAAHDYPLIRKASTTTRMEVRPYKRRGPLVYGNTNRLLKNRNWDIDVSKTGYIMEAGRCLVMRATFEGEPVSIVLLNSYGKLTPFGDSNRLRKWMLAGG